MFVESEDCFWLWSIVAALPIVEFRWKKLSVPRNAIVTSEIRIIVNAMAVFLLLLAFLIIAKCIEYQVLKARYNQLAI